MALPILATLSKSVRAVYPIVRKAVRLGISGNQIQNLLIASGVGVARAPLLKLIAAERSNQARNTQLKFIGLDKMPNPSRLGKALTKIQRQFSYIVLIESYDAFLDENVPVYMTVSLTKNRTRREIEAMAKVAFENDNKRYPLKFIAMQLIEGIVAGVLGTLK